MRKPLIAGNWKMYKGPSEAAVLARELRQVLSQLRDRVELVVAPPSVSISSVAKVLEGSNLAVAGQNCHAEPQGAFTGEVSASMLGDAGCTWVLLGHSERRQYFGETDEGVSAKVAAVHKAGLSAMVCVGETLAEREAGKTLEVVERQIHKALAAHVSIWSRVAVAYEPVWAIGTGKTATSRQAQEVHAHLRGCLAKLASASAADSMRILYGGSVKPDNAKELLSEPDIDGALVGGASLKAADFAAIAKAAAA